MRTPNNQQPKKIPPPRPSHPTSIGNTQSNPSFFSTMTQGAALGIGSSAGHRIVDGLFEPQENKKICLDKAPYKNKEPTITFDDPYLCNKKMEQYVKCTHEQSFVAGFPSEILGNESRFCSGSQSEPTQNTPNHSICDKLYDNYLQCVSSHLERE